MLSVWHWVDEGDSKKQATYYPKIEEIIFLLSPPSSSQLEEQQTLEEAINVATAAMQ